MEKREAIRLLHQKNPVLVLSTEGVVAAANRGTERLIRPEGIIDRYWLEALYKARQVFPYDKNEDLWNLNLGLLAAVADRHENTRPALYEIAHAIYTDHPPLVKQEALQELDPSALRRSPFSLALAHDQGYIDGWLTYTGVFEDGEMRGHLLRFVMARKGREGWVQGLVGGSLDLSISGGQMPVREYVQSGHGFADHHQSPGVKFAILRG